MLRQHDEHRAEAMFERMMNDFLKRWRPEGEDGYDFESHLHTLIRRTIIDAQEPLHRQMVKIVEASSALASVRLFPNHSEP